jgi:hypothetical protein
MLTAAFDWLLVFALAALATLAAMIEPWVGALMAGAAFVAGLILCAVKGEREP